MLGTVTRGKHARDKRVVKVGLERTIMTIDYVQSIEVGDRDVIRSDADDGAYSLRLYHLTVSPTG